MGGKANKGGGGKAQVCTQCCSVYSFVCSLILITFSGMLQGCVSFDVIAITHKWDLPQKQRAALLASGYYFVLAVVLAVHGYLWPYFRHRCTSHSDESDQEYLIEAGSHKPHQTKDGRWTFSKRGRGSGRGLGYGADKAGEEELMSMSGGRQNSTRATDSINRSMEEASRAATHMSVSTNPANEQQQGVTPTGGDYHAT